MSLGAKGGANYLHDGWRKQLQKSAGSMDLIVDSAGGRGCNDLLALAAPGGRVVNYGSTARLHHRRIDTRVLGGASSGPAGEVGLVQAVWKQLQLIGSTMGSPTVFVNTLAFVESHKTKPIIDTAAPVAEVNQQFARMASSDQFGKIVLTNK